MSEIILYEADGHRNLLLEDVSGGDAHAIQTNYHIIEHNDEAMILDPGGHRYFNKVFPDATSRIKGTLRYLFLSHQDPDIVSALNGWLMVTDADAYIPSLWVRFVPHVGIDALGAERLVGVPDEGRWLDLGGAPVALVPGHFLHSSGNLQVWDPTSKILYTGDLGASVGVDYREVTDFDDHIQYIQGFHERYLASSAMLKAWVAFARTLDIQIIAPQHGALFRGPEMVGRFLDWCEGIRCGTDWLIDGFKLPDKKTP